MKNHSIRMRHAAISSITLFFLLLNFAYVPSAKADGHQSYKVPFKLHTGKRRFEKNCSSCHGVWADGTDQGPPLLHRFYVPSHHGDEAFFRAIKQGVKQHHWSFGDMQPVPGVRDKDAKSIVSFLRWLQRESGLIK